MTSRLYVHVPFCARACPYCDFDFEVGRHPARQRYLDALAREWDARGPLAVGETLYVGGGTPSLLGSHGLAELLALLDARAGPVSWRERTVELNPEHVTADLVETLAEHRVDRVSLGVQTFDPAGLRALGRMHDAEAARRAAETCLRAGLRTSVDLIVGWPGQSPAQLARDLAEVVALGVGHVSVYALTIEPDTPWARLVDRGTRRLPDPDQQAGALAEVRTRLQAAGFEHYEVASYARPSERSRHNLGYWTWADYVGLGPSAASARFDAAGVARRTNARGLAAWAGGAPPEEEHLEGERAAAEGLWTGLRALDGVAIPQYLARFPTIDRDWIARRTARAHALGNLEWDRERDVLRVAPERWLFHDAIAAAILDGR